MAALGRHCCVCAIHFFPHLLWASGGAVSYLPPNPQNLAQPLIYEWIPLGDLVSYPSLC